MDEAVVNLARAEAQSHFEKDLIYRRWSALHGGVYVPPTSATPPNPYLTHIPDRDVTTTTGKQLTLINPAYMTRLVHELAAKQSGVQGHITSLTPLRPENAPDDWEAQALQAFATGTREVVELQELQGQPHLRFMRPMVTEAPCLKCHAQQGYQEGDQRGGISISVPLTPYLAIATDHHRSLLLGHGTLACIGLLGIWGGTRRLRHSERALRQSLEESGQLASRNALLLASLGEGVYGIDARGNCIFINPAALALLGLTEAEVLGQDQHQLFHNRKRDGAPYPHEECPVHQTLQDGLRRETEDAFLRKSGELFPVRLTVTPMHQGNTLVGAIVAFQDITAECAARAALIESEERYRTIADYTYDWEYWQGPDQAFRYMSPSCQRITGYALEEFMARPELMNEIIHPDDRTEMANHLHEIHTHDSCAVDFRIFTRSGEIRWIAHGCRAVYARDGRYLGRRANNRDVTAAKQAELEYATIVRTAQDGFLVLDANARFLDTNDAYCRMLGYNREELLRLEAADVDVVESQEDVRRRTEEIQQCGHAQFETRHRRRDGEVIDVEVTVNRLDLHGGVLIAFIRNITERKRSQAELERYRQHLEDLVTARTADLEIARDRAETANRAKSAFLNTMSHELRTPMNAIMGFTQILQLRQPSPEQRDKLNKIAQSSDHLLKLINDILEFSNREATRRAVVWDELEMQPMLLELMDSIRDRANAKGIKLNIETGALPPRLQGDGTRLRQALHNYLGNAVKFTDRGHITLRALPLREDGEDIQVRFEVEDTGIGIAEQARAQLFQAFEQADSSNTRKYGGSGLGLAINKRLASLMDGEVGVESREGQGSRFWITARMGKAG